MLELLCTPTLAAILALAPDRGAAAHERMPGDRIGDLNRDGVVDYDDVIDHLFLWGPCDVRSCVGDLDTDGFIDVLDFLELLSRLDHLPLMVDARPT